MIFLGPIQNKKFSSELRPDQMPSDTSVTNQTSSQEYMAESPTYKHSASSLIPIHLQLIPKDSRRNSADTIQQLQRRIVELEQECQYAKSMLTQAHTVSRLPNAQPSAHFQSQWRARTEARKRIFCSINRAGNALCSWHDSRRMFPPQNAPAGYLNCGCTYEEVLFEESLAHHGVGDYHFGENARMDPALRNPLLRLLQQRYNYKDGDFDHDPVTESWNDGESTAACTD